MGAFFFFFFFGGGGTLWVLFQRQDERHLLSIVRHMFHGKAYPGIGALL